MSDELVLIRREEKVGTIILNRPQAMNYVDGVMALEIDRALQDFAKWFFRPYCPRILEVDHSWNFGQMGSGNRLSRVIQFRLPLQRLQNAFDFHSQILVPGRGG